MILKYCFAGFQANQSMKLKHKISGLRNHFLKNRSGKTLIFILVFSFKIIIQFHEKTREVVANLFQIFHEIEKIHRICML